MTKRRRAYFTIFVHSAPVSVDLVLTNGKRMVKALPMALPGGPQGCMTIDYYRGGDKAPQKRPDG